MKKILLLSFVLLGCGNRQEPVQEVVQEAEPCDVPTYLPGGTYAGEIWCVVNSSPLSRDLFGNCFEAQEDCQRMVEENRQDGYDHYQGCLERSSGFAMDHIYPESYCHHQEIHHNIFSDLISCISYRNFTDSNKLHPNDVRSTCYEISYPEKEEELARQERSMVRDVFSRWTYHENVDEMDGEVIKAGYLSSVWTGGKQARLFIRKSGDGLSVGLHLDDSVRCSSYSGCSLEVKFDDQLMRVEARGGSNSNFVRFRGTRRNTIRDFVRRISNSERVLIRVPLYRGGSPIFEFFVSELDLSRLQLQED